jgi:hypothetical protein
MLEHWPQGLQIGFSKFDGILSSTLGHIENIFSISASTLKPLLGELISTFALIGMLDLS